MKQILEAKGWVKYYECNTCGHKQFYKNVNNPGYEIRTRVKNNTFSILLNNMIIAGPFWGYQLEEKISQYVK